MRFLEATVLAAAVSLSTAALFAPNQPQVAFAAGRRGLVSTVNDDKTSSLQVTLDTRGGASKKKKKKKAPKKEEEEPKETVDAEQLYLPGLLDTVIRRTNQVCVCVYVCMCI